MSILSTYLRNAGVPKAALDAVQEVIDEHKGDLFGKIPTADVLANSVRRQEAYKVALRQLSKENQKAVDKMLETVCQGALVKVAKALGVEL